MRKCPKCGKVLPDNMFAPHTKYCRICRRDYDWQYRYGISAEQYCKGQAVDFTVSGYTPAQLVTLIKGYGIEFDQLINEYDQWVHISYIKGNNRRQVLKY